jgi:hypothetical protein
MQLALLSNFFTGGKWKIDFLEAAESFGDVKIVTSTTNVYENVKGCDVFIWIRTNGFSPTMEECLQKLKNDGTKTVSIHFDAYWDFPDRAREIGKSAFWKSDFVFTSDAANRPWASRGVNHFYLPSGAGGERAKMGQFRAKYNSDIVFFGMTEGYPGGPGRNDHIKWLQQTYKNRFKLYGPSTPNGPIYEPELNDLIASSKLIFSYSANANGDAQAWSDRIPNTMAQRALILHPHVDAFKEEGFVNGQTLLTFEPYNFFVLEGIINRVLCNSQRYDIIRKQAQELILERHTWEKRIEYILDVINKN